MSVEGVKAGKAYVELSILDRTSKGLDVAKQKLASWAQGLAIAGGGMIGAAGAIFAPLGKAVADFVAQGSQLDDIRQMTGVSAEMLSALGYAAKMSGTELTAVHAGLRGLAKFTEQVASGGKAAVGMLGLLGIAANDFLAASPDQRLALVADGLAKVRDPALRAAMAMRMLGKSGEALLPMLADGSAGLNDLVQEARDLGLVISDEDAAKAAKLGDAWDQLGMALGAIAFRTGAALADVMTTISNIVVRGAVMVGQFIAANQTLVLILASVAAAVAGIGAALLAASGAGMVLVGITYLLTGTLAAITGIVQFAAASWAALIAIKTAVAAANTWLATTLTAEGLAALWASLQSSWLGTMFTAQGWSALFAAAQTKLLTVATAAFGAVVSFLTAPLTILIATLVGLAAAALYAVYAFFTMTTVGQFMAIELAVGFAKLLGIAVQTVRGIFDAIMAGRWDLAGEVLMKGLAAAWFQGIATLQTSWSLFKEWFVNLFAQALVGIAQSFDSFLNRMLEGINYLRSQLGMEAIKGFNITASAERAAQTVKIGAAANRKREIDAARLPVQVAREQLNHATKAAADARQAQADKRRAAFRGMLEMGMAGQGVATPGGANLGTFSAAVAGLLGRSAPDSAAERTADATESMAETLDKIESLMGDMGVNWQ